MRGSWLSAAQILTARRQEQLLMSKKLLAEARSTVVYTFQGDVTRFRTQNLGATVHELMSTKSTIVSKTCV